jgi:hypothetical protein
MHGAHKRALIIGIGAYPPEKGWTKINGDKDIPLIEEVLLSNGFTSDNIIKLSNSQAKKRNISDEIKKLIDISHAGDYVYLHFSGHGQLVNDRNGDEEDGLDESWIPYDAHAIYKEGIYCGEMHILDDEIYEWCKSIKHKIGKSGKLIIVSDACHSGDGYRSEDDTIRGRMLNKFLQKAESFVFNYPCSLEKESHFSPTQQKEDIDWIYISACRDDQNNHEYKQKGALSCALYDLRFQLKTLKYNCLQQEIQNWMLQRVPNQTPTIIWSNKTKTGTLF